MAVMRVKNSPLRSALGVLVLAVPLAACGGGEQTTTAPPPGARHVDTAKAGDVTGRVMLNGQPPKTPAPQMDAVCERESAGAPAVEQVVVHDGGLENVFVYVKDGLGNYYFETPSDPVKVDQKGCQYVPRVFGVRAGQPIEISNSDATMHNVNALSEVNQRFNFSQPMAGMRDRRTFKAREVMVRMKCDVHPWMAAYAGVIDHPYFAVTGNGGRFELKDVPAGTYTVEAWHERLGTQSQQVTLGENESKDVTFTFTATTVP
jgi:plastocyanin